MKQASQNFEPFKPDVLGNILLVDTCFGTVSAGLVKDGAFVGEITHDGGAIENLFPLITALENKLSFKTASLTACGLCVGVGSVLGIRTASAALSTIAFACEKPKSLFSWNLFDAAAARARKLCAAADFLIVAPSRKNFVNAAWRIDAVSEVSEMPIEDFCAKFSQLPIATFYIAQKPIADDRLNFLKNAGTMRLSLREIWDFALDGTLNLQLRPIPPDATLLSKREYVKWNFQARI